jgi:hypothetical protein
MEFEKSGRWMQDLVVTLQRIMIELSKIEDQIGLGWTLEVNNWTWDVVGFRKTNLETCESLDKSEGQALEDAISHRAGVIARLFSPRGVSALVSPNDDDPLVNLTAAGETGTRETVKVEPSWRWRRLCT